jgi:hypothetical protein
MRGAPQVGFSETIRKIKARTSLLTRFRPPTCLNLETHVQYKRNPARCQSRRFGSDQDERLPPRGPERSHRNPEKLVQDSQSSARTFRVQSQQLPTESQVFEDKVLAAAKNADHPAEEMSERHDHGKNIIGAIRIQLCVKSLILQMYDILARHNTGKCVNPESLASQSILVSVNVRSSNLFSHPKQNRLPFESVTFCTVFSMGAEQ